MFYRAGEVCSCGSKIRAAFVPDHTATVLARFDAAGAIELGRLNLAEFALGPTGHNEHFGRCRNPWNPEHITGGSSSGSGAAVAAGLAFGALGSDTGGSVQSAGGRLRRRRHQADAGPREPIRRHAALPLARLHWRSGAQRRRLRASPVVIAGADDRDGMSSRQPVQDYERGLEDAAASGALAGVTIGVPDRYYYDGIDAEVGELLADSRALLEKRGAQDRGRAGRRPRRAQRSRRRGGDGRGCRRASAVAARAAAGLLPQVRARLLVGVGVPATLYLQALHARSRLARRSLLREPFATCDVLHMPVLKRPVPTAAETNVGGVAGDGGSARARSSPTRVRSTFSACPASRCRSA